VPLPAPGGHVGLSGLAEGPRVAPRERTCFRREA
jgi:hypothetical protein